MLARPFIAAVLALLISSAAAAPAKDKANTAPQVNAPVVLACTDRSHHVDRFTIDVDKKTVTTTRADLTCKLGFVTDDVYKLDCQTGQGISLLFIDRATGAMQAVGNGSDAKCEKAAKNL